MTRLLFGRSLSARCKLEVYAVPPYAHSFDAPLYPTEWDADYGGKAEESCSEVGTTGVFSRSYPKATVAWDCNTGHGMITMK